MLVLVVTLTALIKLLSNFILLIYCWTRKCLLMLKVDLFGLTPTAFAAWDRSPSWPTGVAFASQLLNPHLGVNG